MYLEKKIHKYFLMLFIFIVFIFIKKRTPTEKVNGGVVTGGVVTGSKYINKESLGGSLTFPPSFPKHRMF